MNTLKYKVLLVKCSFGIFFRAMGWYLLLTALWVFSPPMYLMSAFFAFSFGLIAWLIFLAVLCMLLILKKERLMMPALYLGVALGVLLAFKCTEFAGIDDDIWQFFVFPLLGMTAGWIEVFRSRKRIRVTLRLIGRRNMFSLSPVL